MRRSDRRPSGVSGGAADERLSSIRWARHRSHAFSFIRSASPPPASFGCAVAHSGSTSRRGRALLPPPLVMMMMMTSLRAHWVRGALRAASHQSQRTRPRLARSAVSLLAGYRPPVACCHAMSSPALECKEGDDHPARPLSAPPSTSPPADQRRRGPHCSWPWICPNSECEIHIYQRCHKDTALHCISECLGAADWLAALLPGRSWLTVGLRQHPSLRLHIPAGANRTAERLDTAPPRGRSEVAHVASPPAAAAAARVSTAHGAGRRVGPRRTDRADAGGG